MNEHQFLDFWVDASYVIRHAMTMRFREIGALGFPREQPIYHYTNAQGLKGIVENNSLWATDVSYMNDSQELSYGLALIEQVARQELDRADLSPNVRLILNGLVRHIEHKTGESIFVCCFTSKKDQLSQWRGYTGSGVGYSIGFNQPNFDEDVRASFIKVIYKEEQQKSLIKFFLDEVTSRFSLVENIGEVVNIEPVLLEIKTLAVELSAGFKHPGFSEEEEYRYILHGKYQSSSTLHVREKKGMLIPYLELKAKDEKPLPIVEVIIATDEGFERAKLGVITLFRVTPKFVDKYPSINPSRISFRFT